jgi:glycosyltransferase involved in cell wall biosynthesis
VVNELTAVVLTLNEENYISECLESLKWCQQVVVLDSLSTDRTVEIAHQMGARVVQRLFINFADQRNKGIELVDSEWILFVDADERVTPELAEEVSRVIGDAEYDGWWIPRKNNYFEKWMNYGGFYPDYQLRLARRAKLHFDTLEKVHETPTLNGKAGYLKSHLLHLCYQNIHELKETKNKYADLLAEVHYEKGVKPSYHLLAAPILTFFEQLIRLKGYKDGWRGWLISIIWAYYAFEEYRRTLVLWITSSRKKIVA